MTIYTTSFATAAAVGIGLLSLFSGTSQAAETIFGQTFYSVNNGLNQSNGSLVWTTPTTAINSEMHTNLGPFSLAVGEKFQVSFGLRFFEPEGDGGNSATDGIRLGLLDLTTQTFADGTHAATTGDGYRFRFNWETATGVQGGDASERALAGSNANYLTSSGGIWDAAGGISAINGYGLNADGANSYPVVFSVERTNATDAIVSLSINGVVRSYTDTGDGLFTFDTLALAKIGDAGPFQQSSTFTITNFTATVIPEPSTVLLAVVGLGAMAMRRRRANA